MALTVAELQGLLTLDDRQFRRGMGGASRSMRDLRDTGQQTATGLQGAFRKLAVVVGATFVGTGGAGHRGRDGPPGSRPETRPVTSPGRGWAALGPRNPTNRQIPAPSDNAPVPHKRPGQSACGALSATGGYWP